MSRSLLIYRVTRIFFRVRAKAKWKQLGLALRALRSQRILIEQRLFAKSEKIRLTFKRYQSVLFGRTIFLPSNHVCSLCKLYCQHKTLRYSFHQFCQASRLTAKLNYF